ncbi:hypothetical protein E1B28_012879 [Marasmius oreades]|uniref:Uncharacterized protein n=1 Tax=Marasmius oreades TaxID=181124 RepID=A0A9P7RSI7_9AGAR|nr:uncharacterized protein E1B28_012879 [Marasmius oreades]KAG7088934.1 hypothetical protein E1B28_012879 [Marasmius oreades]
MPSNVWCTHCSEYVTRKRAREHRNLMYSPYSHTASTVIPSTQFPPHTSVPEPILPPPEQSFLDDDEPLNEIAGPRPFKLSTGEPMNPVLRARVEDADSDDGDEMDCDDWRELDPADAERLDEEDMFAWEQFQQQYCVQHAGLTFEDNMRLEYEWNATNTTLGEYDVAICRAFAFKVTEHITDKAFEKVPFAFPRGPEQTPLPKLDSLNSRIKLLARIYPQLYDMCPQSCCCYAGAYEKLDKCPFCEEPCFRSDRCARKHFTYIPLIPRLKAFARSEPMATKMRYHGHEHQHVPGMSSDIFDGKSYRRLLQ